MLRTILLLAVIALTAPPAGAAVVEVQIPLDDIGDFSFDLGVAVEQVNAVSLHVQGTSQQWYYECHNAYPGGEVDYDHWDTLHYFIIITSGGHQTDQDWYSSGSSFDESIPFPVYSSMTGFLADGTGRLQHSAWIELFEPEVYDCSVSVPGFVEFSAPWVLRVDYTPAVPTEASGWGAVKTLYH